MNNHLQRWWVLALTLCASACTTEAEQRRIEAEKQRVAAEEKRKQDEELERRAEKLAEEKKQQDEQIEAKAKQLAVEMAKEMHAEQKKEEAKDKVERKREALAILQRNPAPFFEASGMEFFNKGIVNRYQQLTKVTLTNKSAFFVRDIRGQVDFLDNRNETVATIPVHLEGPLPPRGTRTYSGTEITGNTVQTDATKARFLVTTAVADDS